MLLASAYDQSRYFKAADMQAAKKLRIKDVTEEEIGVGQDKEKKLCVWFTNDPRGLVLEQNQQSNTARCVWRQLRRLEGEDHRRVPHHR